MEISKVNKNLNSSSNTFNLNYNSKTTRWNEVFGNVSQNYSNTQSNNSNSNIKISSTRAYSSSLNIQASKIEYERYKLFNDMEVKFQKNNLYKTEEIINPYHHTNTNNPFNDELKDEISSNYSNWDGNAKEKEGFAYVDKYGYTHVSSNFYTAMIYSRDNKVYEYKGETQGGYAKDAKGNRLFLAKLDKSVPFGNDGFEKSNNLISNSKQANEINNGSNDINYNYTNSTLTDNRTYNLFDVSTYLNSTYSFSNSNQFDYNKSKYDQYLW